jgi:hypothetical protein
MPKPPVKKAKLLPDLSGWKPGPHWYTFDDGVYQYQICGGDGHWAWIRERDGEYCELETHRPAGTGTHFPNPRAALADLNACLGRES